MICLRFETVASDLKIAAIGSSYIEMCEALWELAEAAIF